MGEEQKKSPATAYKWILFFYSVPSSPVSNRMTVWRKLMKSGAIPLKGAVYILPFTAEHSEFLHWLAAEVKGMNGDAVVVSIEKIDTIKDSEVVELFRQARKNDYLAIKKDLEEVVRKLNNIKKGGLARNQKGIFGQLAKIDKAFTETEKIDFFASAEGVSLRAKIDLARHELKALMGTDQRVEQKMVLTSKRRTDYQGRVWATRKHPFVDRMACAWLIKRFIDPDAAFAFIDEDKIDSLPPTTIVFDMYGGEFTHAGDLCTFEVLLKVFCLKNKALRRIAETVHDLDLKDAKYQTADAVGIETILAGIRKTAKDDDDALAQGMQVFEMLYVSKK